MGYRADGYVEIALTEEDQVAFTLSIEKYLRVAHDAKNGMSVPLYETFTSHSVFDIIEAIFLRWGFTDHRLHELSEDKATRYTSRAGHKWFAGMEVYEFLKFLASLGGEVYGYFRGERGDVWEYIRDEDDPNLGLIYREYQLVATSELRALEASKQSLLSVVKAWRDPSDHENVDAKIAEALDVFTQGSRNGGSRFTVAPGAYLYQLLCQAYAAEHYIEESLSFFATRKDAEIECLRYIVKEAQHFENPPWGTFPEGTNSLEDVSSPRYQAMSTWFTSHSFDEVNTWYHITIKARPSVNSQGFDIAEKQIAHSSIPLRLQLDMMAEKWPSA